MFTQEEFNKVYEKILARIINNKNLKKERKAYILGGQSGAGKSTFFKMHNKASDFYVVNGDDYRQYHPHYLDIIQKNITDMPMLTQAFSNKVVETLIKQLSDEGYNIIVEGTLRTAEVPIKTCNELSVKGYKTDLIVVACDAGVSWESTFERAQILADNGVFPRFVPIDIYTDTVNSICSNVKKIQDEDCFNTISIIDREGNVLYPNNEGMSISEALEHEIKPNSWNNNLKDYINDFEYKKEKIIEKYSLKTCSLSNSKISFKEKLQMAKQKSDEINLSTKRISCKKNTIVR